MARVSITHICGCGYKTLSLEEAVKHSDSHSHKMEVHGTIHPDKPVLAASIRAGVVTRNFIARREPIADFADLRARLQSTKGG